ncbi:hypothetical protein JL193_06285 [Polaribacter batillariae]|uniref:Lipoprotein n=1 Tax=Polaribacter batillariae TaxID=2808900 RepID=A0ABX7SXD3_9FLAO|nr:hypothetical protein [Polaribacter batillariae]QTD38861.1 hypothetical protein JL193_06285 [Polaribacter batillariae]
MNCKRFLFFFIFIATFFSCSEDSDVIVPRNLQQYVDENSNLELDDLIACAANADGNTSLNYIFYYPEAGATDIRYYETKDVNVNEKDYSNYRRETLRQEDVFGGKLQRFLRSGATETWCLVTYIKEGKLHISNPIRLKNASKDTEYNSEVAIDYTKTLEPRFTWKDGTIQENEIYFQVISDEENNFISGTYTKEKTFKYYDTSNVVLNINTTKPKDLVEDEIYNFTLMGVSEDNWVNLIIEKQFIPRSLEEYIAVHTDKTINTARAFAANANGNKETTYIYYQPVADAYDFRYYETEDTSVLKTDFSNYRRKNLTSTPALGNKFRRFSNNSSKEVWCIVTFISGDKLYVSDPIKTKNQTKTTEWKSEITIDDSETLKPRFTWTDGTHTDNVKYLQIFTKKDDSFLSGTYTTEKTFKYYDTSNVTENLNKSTPPAFVLDDENTLTLFGISEDNWVNLVIQKIFIVQ